MNHLFDKKLLIVSFFACQLIELIKWHNKKENDDVKHWMTYQQMSMTSVDESQHKKGVDWKNSEKESKSEQIAIFQYVFQ